MRKLLREPLFHFLVLGTLIFAGYELLNRNGEPAPGRIVVSQGQLASMREAFIRTWQRPPTGEELEGLIRDRVREEVYCREAMALGLDRDDTIIRRRLRQKMEFVSDDIAAQTEPTDAELNSFLQAHPDKFRVEQQFTFRQLYLNPEMLNWHFSKWGSIQAGYRWLFSDYSQGSGTSQFRYNILTQGPQLGFTLHF